MSFDPKRWDAIELIESQRAELKAFADERGFVLQAGRGVVHEGGEFLALWMAWGEGAAAKRYPTVEGSLSAWPEPITEGHYHNFGYLTEIDFVRNRSAGWEESAAIMLAHYESAVGLDEDERALRLRGVVQRQQKVEERASKYYREAYRKAAGNRLDDSDLIADQHISALDIRVKGLRRELEKVGDHSLDQFGPDALDWLYVASALAEDYRQALTPDEWLRGSIEDQILRLHSGFGYGASPDLMMNYADTLLRHELGLPEVIIAAQLSGLVFLLNSREPYLREATHLRDKLSRYETLLQYAIRDEPPLSEEALERLTTRETPPWLELHPAPANSDWGPLVRYLALAMIEKPGAFRDELATHFGHVCLRYSESAEYCESKRLSPGEIPYDTLSRYKGPAKRFLDSHKW